MYRQDVEEEGVAPGAGGAAQPKSAGPTAVAPAAVKPKRKVQGPTDGYLEKLVKYVPAEVVAFFAPIASLVESQRPLLIASGVVGLIATPTYLWANAKGLEKRQRPPAYYYVLSTAAFVVWALATSKLGALLHLTGVSMAFTLGVAVFVIPLADKLLSRK